jgi:serine/threonine-protein kinase
MLQGEAEEAAGVREGQILAGRYRVEKVLGVGGMGVVVAAHHVHLDEKVAIKFLLPTMLGNQEVVGRFAREARAAVRIKSEHVARVTDVGTLENGAPYMVMEFLEGGDLAAWIQRQGPLPIEQAVDFILQACVGVASAHGMAIVHRDLKPANLFCMRGNDGQFIIKVLDFGISKITNLSASDAVGSMTHTTAVMGSPLYMSPEQMQSAKDVDTRTDIWALGVVLYELLTGTTPFAGESFTDVTIKVATASFVTVRTFRPDIPAGIEAVLLKCLEKDKTRRYSNVAELALALADFGSKQSRPSVERTVRIIQASGLSASALALPPSPIGYAPIGTIAPSASTTPGVPTTRARRTAAAAIGAVAVLSVAAGVGWKMRLKAEPHVAAVGVALPPTTAAAPEALPMATASTPQSASTVQPTTVQRSQAEPKKTAPSGTKAAPSSAPPETVTPPRNVTKPPPVAGSSGSRPFNPLFDLKPQ